MVVEKLILTFNASTAKIERQSNSFSLRLERGLESQITLKEIEHRNTQTRKLCVQGLGTGVWEMKRGNKHTLSDTTYEIMEMYFITRNIHLS